MIHWLTINNNPSNPQQPIQQPYVKRTSKFQFASKRQQQFGRFGMIPPDSPEVRSSWRLVRWSDLGTRHGRGATPIAVAPAQVYRPEFAMFRVEDQVGTPAVRGLFSRITERLDMHIA